MLTADASSGSATFNSRRWRISLALLGALGAALGVATMNFQPVGAAGDDAMYVMLARALATGQGYLSLNLPGSPPNTHFPPGYPAVLALLWRVAPEFPANLTLFRAFNVLCLGAIAVATARLIARRGGGFTTAIVTGVLTAVSIPLLILGAMLLSEPLFLALLLALLPALESLADESPLVRSDWRPALLAGIAIGFCTLIRSHGIVLVPAMMLMLVFRGRHRHALLVAAGAALCIVPWQIWCARNGGALPAPLAGGYGSYSAWWLDGVREMGWSMVPRTLVRTVGDMTGLFAALFSPVRGAAAHMATLFALAMVTAAGVAVSWRRIPVTLLFLAGYMVLVAIWPFHPARFVWGVWPLFLMLLVLGTRAALASVHRWHVVLRGIVAASALWVAVGYAAYEARGVRGRWWSSIPRAGLDHIALAVGWTRDNTGPDDIVATEDEGAVFLYTGRRTVPVRAFTASQYLLPAQPATLAAQGLIPLLATFPVRAVIVYSRTAQDVAHVLASSAPPRLTLVGLYPAGAAYIVLPR